MVSDDTHGHELLVTRIITILSAGEMAWYRMADRYQSGYGGSSDYDKSFKRAYLEKGEACHLAADAIRNLVPATSGEARREYVVAIRRAALRAPLSDEDAGKLEALLAELDPDDAPRPA